MTTRVIEQFVHLAPEHQAAMIRVADRTRDWMNRRLDNQALDLARLYRSSQDTLNQRLKYVYETFLKEEPTLVKARLTGAGAMIQRAIADTTDELGRHLYDQSTQMMSALLSEQRPQLRRFLPAWGAAFGDLPVSSQSVLNELTTAVIGGGTYMDRMFHLTDQLKDRLTHTTRQSLLNGDDFETLRGRVQKLFGVDKLREPASTAYGSVKVYKNEARRQWNNLMDDVAKDTDGIEYWYALIDEASTPGCVARHGRKLSELDDAPPRHFNSFHPDTELLTKRGFVPVSELSEQDLFLSMNPDSHEIEWVGVARNHGHPGIISHYHDGPMVHIKAYNFDLCVTPDHEIAHVSDWKFKDRRRQITKKPASQISGWDHVPRSGKWIGESVETLEVVGVTYPAGDFMEFLGWYLSEGSVTRNVIQISQSEKNETHKNRIEKLCRRLFSKVRRSKDGVHITGVVELARFLNSLGLSHEKYLPEQFKLLSPTLLERFLESFCFGDGHVTQPFWKGKPFWKFSPLRSFFTSSKRLSDDLAEVLIKCGSVPSFEWSRFRQQRLTVKHKNGVYITKHPAIGIVESKRSWFKITKESIRQVQYVGNVYCVELEKHHLVYARRNGKCTWVGQCRCEIAVLPRGADTSDMLAEADAWLQAEGYTRREAVMEESEALGSTEKSFQWGRFKLAAFGMLQFAEYEEREKEPGEYLYHSVPYEKLPEIAKGGLAAGGPAISNWGAWPAGNLTYDRPLGMGQPKLYFAVSPNVAQDRSEPNHVLLRVATSTLRTRGLKTEAENHEYSLASGRAKPWEIQVMGEDGGWKPLGRQQTPPGRWIQTLSGYSVPDGPDMGRVIPPRRRFPEDVLARWPQLRPTTIPEARNGEKYAARGLPGPQAEALALGDEVDGPWKVATTLSDAVRDALMGVLALQDPYLAVAVIPEGRYPSRSTLKLVVSLSTGAVIYASEEFPEGLTATYKRAAVVCVDDGKIWAVRPRGKDFYSLPGGHVNENETPVQAAVREMQEETGITITPIRRLGVIYRPWATTTVFLGVKKQMTAPTDFDEIDALLPIRLNDLEPSERAWLKRKIQAVEVHTREGGPGSGPRPGQPHPHLGGARSTPKGQILVARFPGGEAAIQDMVKTNGGIYHGVDDFGLVSVTEPKSGSTGAIPLKDLSPKAIQDKMAEKRALFGFE